MASQFKHISNRSHDLWGRMLTQSAIIATAGERIAEDFADKILWAIGRVLRENEAGEARQ